MTNAILYILAVINTIIINRRILKMMQNDDNDDGDDDDVDELFLWYG